MRAGMPKGTTAGLPCLRDRFRIGQRFPSFQLASLGVERFLNHIIVTPRMHGIHHAIVERETDSNWGTIFCWWDKIHRSLRRDIREEEITIGVAAFRDEEELTVGKLLALPFGEQRPWKLPTGEVPTREPRPAKELQP